jgi:Transglutaminase-like superfamily
VRRRLNPATLRAALWTFRALAHARRHLRRSGLEGLHLPRLPSLPASAERGVQAALRRRQHTCLERAVVLQHWHAGQGDLRDVVIGVSGDAVDFRAHAWLEHDEAEDDHARFHELRRVRP